MRKTIFALAVLFASSANADIPAYRACIARFEPERHDKELRLAVTVLSMNLLRTYTLSEEINQFHAHVAAMCKPLLAAGELADEFRRDYENARYIAEERRSGRLRN
jgi:hypothetical protein